jgi:hypothetical protein
MAKGRQGPSCRGFSSIRRRDAPLDARKSLFHIGFFAYPKIHKWVTFDGRRRGPATKL